MVTEEFQSKISFEKFELDSAEMETAKKIVDKYAEKLMRLIPRYEEIRLEMKVRKKGKNNHFQIKGLVFFQGVRVASEDQDMNPFVAIDSVMKKMLVEIEHKANKIK